MASLVIKPLLAPLLVIPVVRGHWRVLLWPGGCAVVILVAAVLTLPGAADVAPVMHRVVRGSALVGDHAVYNLSLSGLGERLHERAILDLLRVGVVATVIWVTARSRRHTFCTGTTAAVGAMLLLGTFLAGTISESHFILVALPCLVVAVALNPSRLGTAIAVIGFAELWVPRVYLSHDFSPEFLQVRDIVGEFLLFVAAAWVAAVPGPNPGRDSVSAAT
jgi:hypothetical protein